MEYPALFEPLALAPGLVLRNRIVMAPMTTWAANDDGTVADAEAHYYRLRARDVGLVITGCTHVQANGAGFTGEFAAHDDRYLPSLRKLALAAKSGGAPAILQIFHAGVKTSPVLVDDIVAASAVAGEAGPFAPAVTPRALRDEEIVDVIGAFAAATRRAIAAGFDGVELHGAHGFLLQNFLSPHSNRRTDRWGGSLDHRMRFPLAVAAAVRQTIAAHSERPFALGYRITVEEPMADGLQLAHALALVDHLIDGGVNYLHVSLGDALAQRPASGAQDDTIIDVVHRHLAGRVPLLAAGGLRTPQQAASALAAGLSAVAVGQALVMAPNWVALARTGHASDIRRSIAAADAPGAGIPPKLWSVIEATPGWFNVSH
jgi:2,4-dienoyl-CoA reductase-like NADH-dependent reductase (Old Yellow Enzyme family)